MERSPSYNLALDQFVELWGEMASAWGITKTMAQIHALLYAESHPLDTDTIMEKLDISRGNANMNLRQLLGWKLIHKIQIKKNRKDFYEAERNVWNIVSIIINVRHQQEILPIRTKLIECSETLGREGLTDQESIDFSERIQNYIEFLEMFERFTAALLPYINKNNVGFIKQLVKLVEVKKFLSGKR